MALLTACLSPKYLEYSDALVFMCEAQDGFLRPYVCTDPFSAMQFAHYGNYQGKIDARFVNWWSFRNIAGNDYNPSGQLMAMGETVEFLNLPDLGPDDSARVDYMLRAEYGVRGEWFAFHSDVFTNRSELVLLDGFGQPAHPERPCPMEQLDPGKSAAANASGHGGSVLLLSDTVSLRRRVFAMVDGTAANILEIIEASSIGLTADTVWDVHTAPHVQLAGSPRSSVYVFSLTWDGVSNALDVSCPVHYELLEAASRHAGAALAGANADANPTGAWEVLSDVPCNKLGFTPVLPGCEASAPLHMQHFPQLTDGLFRQLKAAGCTALWVPAVTEHYGVEQEELWLVVVDHGQRLSASAIPSSADAFEKGITYWQSA